MIEMICKTCEYGYYEKEEKLYCEYWGVNCEDVEECDYADAY